MNPLDAREIITRQRDFFDTCATKDITFRVDQLRILRSTVEANRSEILAALKEDMGKPTFEAYVAEISTVLAEIDYTLKKLKAWAKPDRVKTPPYLFLASSRIYREPFGVALIIGPWNYPVDLVMTPLIGAVAAGNCCVVKPSEVAPATSRVIAKMVGESFDPAFIAVVEGGAEETQALLAEKFDYIFYTGGGVVGTIVAEAASHNLTPLTLELGGKSPCIVEPDVHLVDTARRIAWGKFFNAGQTCIAPDYLLVNKRVKERLLREIENCVRNFYGEDPAKSPDFARIINDRHFTRLSRLLEGDIIFGGQTDPASRYISPTLIDNVSLDDPAMLEEIFGPILPVIEYDVLGDAIAVVRGLPKPLSLYVFSRSKEKQERIIRETSAGGGCINDTMVHYASGRLPFGGVGESGFGKYHGRASFETFSNRRSIVDRSFLFDIYLRYPPYKNTLKFVQRFIRYVT